MKLPTGQKMLVVMLLFLSVNSSCHAQDDVALYQQAIRTLSTISTTLAKLLDIVTPTTAPVTPTTAPVTPTTAPVSPTTTPVSPTTAPVTPTTAPVTPTTAPVTPTTTPDSPTTTPDSPTTTPDSPTTTPVTPTTTPDSPTTTPVSPTTTPVSPGNRKKRSVNYLYENNDNSDDICTPQDGANEEKDLCTQLKQILQDIDNTIQVIQNGSITTGTVGKLTKQSNELEIIVYNVKQNPDEIILNNEALSQQVKALDEDVIATEKKVQQDLDDLTKADPTLVIVMGVMGGLVLLGVVAMGGFIVYKKSQMTKTANYHKTLVEERPISMSPPHGGRHNLGFQSDDPQRTCPRPRLEGDQHDPRAVNHDPRAVNHDPRAVNYDPKAANYDPTVVNHDPRAVNYDPKAANYDPRAVNYDPKAANYDPKAANYDPKAANYDPKAANYDPKAANYTNRDKHDRRTRQPQRPPRENGYHSESSRYYSDSAEREGGRTNDDLNDPYSLERRSRNVKRVPTRGLTRVDY